MNGKYLIDTSVAVDLLRGRIETVAALPAEAEFVVCAVVLGELYYGALISARPEEQVRDLERFFMRHPILHTSMEIIQSYAHIKSKLRWQGRMIPENDI
ncbi:tRNA(fMet)-specific endonuclease VapC [Armatimonadetes bacterium GXS]|nr:tRNA(fMet)-specific endonuclease VapC [Armatimonadetes bacterium GXS]